MLDLVGALILRSLLAATFVGVSAPVVGTYLVHKRLSMLGDGIGHVALSGVAAGWLIGAFANLTPNDVLAVPGAVVAALIGALLIEYVQQTERTAAEVVLPILFYGGIAGGVVLTGLAGGSSTQLNSYLFGSVATVSWTEVAYMAVMAVVILACGIGLRPTLFAVTNDRDFSTSIGLPVRKMSYLIAVLSALTIAISMRVVGALLVSALMIVPVAIAQLWSRSFKSTMHWAMLIGLGVSLAGLLTTIEVNLSPGATIVVIAVLLYALAFVVKSLLDRFIVRKTPRTSALDQRKLEKLDQPDQAS